MTFKKTLKNLLLAGTLALSAYGCGDSTPKNNLIIEGTTEKFEYFPGEEVKLRGPIPTEEISQNASHLFKKVTKTADINPSFEIRTKARTFTPETGRLFSPTVLDQIFRSDADRLHVMLQYDGNLTSADREELKNKGILVGHPLGCVDHHAWGLKALCEELLRIADVSGQTLSRPPGAFCKSIYNLLCQRVHGLEHAINSLNTH